MRQSQTRYEEDCLITDKPLFFYIEKDPFKPHRPRLYRDYQTPLRHGRRKARPVVRDVDSFLGRRKTRQVDSCISWHNMVGPGRTFSKESRIRKTLETIRGHLLGASRARSGLRAFPVTERRRIAFFICVLYPVMAMKRKHGHKNQKDQFA